jgi:outer membrane usher protein FimD/PapC
VDSYLQWNAKHGIVSASYQSSGSNETYQATLAGAVGYIDGKFGFSRPIYDSFGLVKLGDLAGVRVSSNNQVIGKTNASGEVFVPNMGSYLENQISIDDKDIPIDYEFKVKEVYVSPGLRSGSLIKFNITRIQAISGRLKIRTETGLKALENNEMKLFDRVSGSAVSEVVVVGKGGEFYIEDIKAGVYEANVAYNSKTCIFNLVIPENREYFTELGDIICEPVH